MRDALAAIARLSRAGMRVAVDRLRGPVAEGVPRSLDEVGPDWLTGALHPAAPGARVRAVRRLGGHSGTTTRARLALEGEGGGLPSSVFVKITPGGLVQRVFGMAARLFEMETRFYSDLSAALPVRVPRVYAARATRDSGRFVLVLEDLAVGGARFVEVGDHADLADARAVMETLAALHAAFWESPRFERDLAWVRARERRAGELRFERFLTRTVIAGARRRFGAGAPPAFHAAARVVSERREALESVWSEGPRTLVHGDCHIGNLFFEGDRVGLLDWQVLARAPGMRDVGYFLCHSVPSEVRERHEEALVSVYLEALRARGVDPPSPEEAWRQYRAFALYGWLAAAFTAGAGGLQEPRIARAGLERATRAIESLGSVALFDAERAPAAAPRYSGR